MTARNSVGEDRVEPGGWLRNPPTRIELLTEQFYAWERRGRGWQLWESPVELEPAYMPFEYQAVTLPAPDFDDGQRPTLASMFADKIKRLIVGPRHERLREEYRTNEFDDEPTAADPTDALTEFRLSVPPKFITSREVTEDFLLSLPAAIQPLSFEIVGLPDTITIQFTCDKTDTSGFLQRLLARFPDIVLVGQDGFLVQSWSRAQGESLCVDFGLANEFMLPLRTPRRLDIDPLTSILAALTQLREGEVAVLQVLFQKTRHPWISSIERAVIDDGGRSFFADAPEFPTLSRQKVSRPLFATIIRVAARSPEPSRVWDITRSVGGALSTFADPTSNELIPLANDGYQDTVHEADLLARMTRRSGMLLNVSELVSLVHPPDASVRVEKLRREERKTKPAPTISTGHDLVLGMNKHGGAATKVTLSPEQRSRHMYMVGASGTGKSTMLLNLIVQDMKRGEGVAVLDPHGDLIDDMLGHVPENRVGDVLVLDPSDADYPVGFNILSAHSELEKTLLSSDLVAVFRRLSTSWGDQMNSVLANAILAFLESERGGTLLDLRRFLVEAPFRREFLKTVQDPEAVYYWQKEFPLLSHKPMSSILTRLNTFLRPKLIRHMVAQKENRFDFGSMMNDGKILLAKLAQGAIGEENAYLLGTLIVAKMQQAAMSRQELAQAKRRPFYLYIDEFHNFITPSMAQILTGARKYRLGLVLAHQDLRQLASRNQEVLDAVITNPYTRVCFRVGDQDARTLEDGFASFDRKDLQNLGTGQAILRVERGEYDFNLDTPPAPSVDKAQAKSTREQVIAASRRKYARSREEVEDLFQHPTAAESPETTVLAQENLPKHVRAKGKTVPHKEPVPSKGAKTPPPVPLDTPTTLPGRGGQQHKYLQHLVKRWAEAHGWRATIEEGILDGLGNVDVAMRKGDRSVACEITITTTPEHELGNVQKCLAAGFERVILVSTKKNMLNKVRSLAKESLSENEFAHVGFGTPEEVFALLEAFDAEAATTEETVKGYKVKVEYKPVGEGEKRARRQAVSQVIAKALKRLKGKDA